MASRDRGPVWYDAPDLEYTRRCIITARDRLADVNGNVVRFCDPDNFDRQGREWDLTASAMCLHQAWREMYQSFEVSRYGLSL